MTYQVWLVTDNAKISAGTFRPDAQGKTMMHAQIRDADRNALRAVAITEEPEGGMPAPTGPMVVRARLSSARSLHDRFQPDDFLPRIFFRPTFS